MCIMKPPLFLPNTTSHAKLAELLISLCQNNTSECLSIFLFPAVLFQGMIVVTSRNTAFNVNNIARVGHMSASQYMHSFFLHNSSLESFKMNFMSRLIRFSVTIIIGVMFLSVFRVVDPSDENQITCVALKNPGSYK